MAWRVLLFFCAAIALQACSRAPTLPDSVARVTTVSQQEKTVRAFIEAFNSHDPEAMAVLCDDAIEWGYVSDQGYDIAGRDKTTLIDQMSSYFAATPGVRSEIEGLLANGDSIAMIERAYWTPRGDDGEKSQSSLAVYQFKEGRIASVRYYPATP